MATTSNTATPAVESAASADQLTAKAVHKRFEGLQMVRMKAVKGKGAWYWAHLEPMLVHNSDTGLPKAVKLRCSLCDAVFSASNPSRTASEHLKRGTCPNFNSLPKPISSISPPPSVAVASPSSGGGSSAVPSLARSNRKRSAGANSAPLSSPSYAVNAATPASAAYHVSPLAIVDPSRFSGELEALPEQPHVPLSGGKDDLGALAMLKDSVKKLKSPKTSPGPALSKNQIDCALDYLADWVYESCGSVSFSALEHPKFRAFLTQVGMPVISRREFAGCRLDLKYEEARAESEAMIRDALFFQIASDGWKTKNTLAFGEVNLVNLSVNLPNGTSLYRRAVFLYGSVPSSYAEELIWETMADICGNFLQQCVGIVADRFKSKALRNLENQNPWMVNLSCQFQGFTSLINDFSKELPMFKTVAENCFKLASFINNKSQIRNSFHKYQLQEYGHAGLIRVPFRGEEHEKLNFGPVYAMIDDILSSAQAFPLVLLDESFKKVAMEDPIGRDVADMIRDPGFWNELEAVHSLVKMIKEMAQEIESQRPLVGQCLPLWDELRSKVKDWCSKFHISEVLVERVIEARFKKNYHPAWSAAYILDPLYLLRDNSGKYLPPFEHLTPEQKKDVDKLITRLVSREEAHIALMELMKWRTEGLDPVYAQAVQMKERDPITGKMRLSNPQSSRLVWETYLTEFKSLGKVAVRLIFLHATACGFKPNCSLLKWVSAHGHSRAAMDKAQKLIFISAHSKLERREFSSDEDKDAELFALANGEDDVLNDVLVDTSAV